MCIHIIKWLHATLPVGQPTDLVILSQSICHLNLVILLLILISDNGAFTWENIDPTLCTHIIYTFVGLNNETFEVNSLDPFLDLEKDGGRGQCQF